MKRSVFAINTVSALLISWVVVPAAAGGSVSYEYDALGRLRTVVDSENGNTDYEYDAAGNRSNGSWDHEGDPPDHEDDPSDVTIAVADMNNNNMTTHDDDCQWEGWTAYSYVQENELSCSGQKIVEVTKPSSQDGQCSVTSVASGYSTEWRFGSPADCHLTIIRD